MLVHFQKRRHAGEQHIVPPSFSLAHGAWAAPRTAHGVTHTSLMPSCIMADNIKASTCTHRVPRLAFLTLVRNPHRKLHICIYRHATVAVQKRFRSALLQHSQVVLGLEPKQRCPGAAECQHCCSEQRHDSNSNCAITHLDLYLQSISVNRQPCPRVNNA